jgi:hypothetical protein
MLSIVDLLGIILLLDVYVVSLHPLFSRCIYGPLSCIYMMFGALLSLHFYLHTFFLIICSVYIQISCMRYIDTDLGIHGTYIVKCTFDIWNISSLCLYFVAIHLNAGYSDSVGIGILRCIIGFKSNLLTIGHLYWDIEMCYRRITRCDISRYLWI